jgi:hypothetical protein
VRVVEYSTADEMREALRSLDGARIRGEREERREEEERAEGRRAAACPATQS